MRHSTFFRHLLFLVLILCSHIGAQAQATYLCNEKFSSKTPQGWSIQPAFSATAPSWKTDTGVVATAKYAMHGYVPFSTGDTAELVTPFYDCSNYNFVMLRFNHICKVLPSDICEIQYQEQGLGYNYRWKNIPKDAYKGSCALYKTDLNFSHDSYKEWCENDTFAKPNSGWYKQETFDITDYASLSKVRFRFIIRKGSYLGSFIASGWYVDDFQLIGSKFAIKPPVVEFLTAPQDTVYSTGPFAIKAKVATRTLARIINPYLTYTAILNGTSKTDSIRMTAIEGDSIWTATIPQHVYGTDISFFIFGRDSVNNTNRATGHFYLKHAGAGTTVFDSTVYGTNFASPYNCATPLCPGGSGPNWSQVLYMGNMVNPNNQGGWIAGIAFYTGNAPGVLPGNIRTDRIYLKSTTLTTLTAATSIDPVKDGATLVFDGSYYTTQGWTKIMFDRAFFLTPGENLLFYRIDTAGNTCSTTRQYYSNNTVSYTGQVYYYTSLECTAGTGTYGNATHVPTTTFYYGNNLSYDSNSVALVSIDNPSEGTVAGKQTVRISLKNKGDKNLTSARINWTVNGVLQTPKTYTGNLPCDFNDTITIGTYIQRRSTYDTITVWVNTPNNVYDSVTEDDTLQVIAFGCDSVMKGVYTVGKSSGSRQYNFATISDALQLLGICGIGGDVDLQLASGVYTENVNFNNFNGFGNYRLTISSIAGNADSVIFRPKSGAVVDLMNSSKLTFKYITFDANKASSYCVNLGAGCDDVEFYHCTLLGKDTNTTSNAFSNIYKASGSTVNDIRFIGNRILGGTDATYFYGSSTTAHNTNILFDSNYIAGAYYYQGYFYYTDITFTNNILEEQPGGYTYYYGPTFYYTNNTRVEGNRIRTHAYANYHYGMRCYYMDSTSYICNNEIIIHNNTTTSYGIYFYYPYGAALANNSILVYGNATTHYGIYTYLYGTYHGSIHNNISITTGASTSYPLYTSSLASVANFDIDYNCLWGDRYVAYLAAAVGDINTYQSKIPTAIHEISMHPTFMDTTVSLKPKTYAGLDCPRLSIVTKDLAGSLRAPLTTMGCYANQPVKNNAALADIINCGEQSYITDTICPSVILTNAGMDPLTEATIRWEVNHVVQGKDVTWKGNLATGQSDTIALGCFIPKSGTNTVTTYLVGIGAVKDTIPSDDTVSTSTYTCISAFAGNYTVGDTGTFKTLDDAISAISLCGMGGPVTLRVLPGTYYMNTTIGFINGSSATNTLTITSYTGDSSSVILQRADDASSQLAPLMIDGGQHIIIEKVSLYGISPTSNTYTYSHGIMITGTSHHIEVRNCYLMIPKNFASAVTSYNHAIVHMKGNLVHHVYIHDNLMEGGANAFYVYGSSSTARISNIRMENNEIGYIDYSAFYMYYSDSVLVKGNRITQRTGNFAPGNMYMLYGYYTNADIINNSFHCQNIYYGMYLYYFGDTAKNLGYIINNELISSYGTATGYAVYLSTASQVQMYHNSFYMTPNGTTNYGIYVVSAAATICDIRNNIVCMMNEKVNAYPVYLAATTYLANNQWYLNYNDYYNACQPTPNIGYAGGARTSMAAWRGSVACDTASVNLRPNFLNVQNNLRLKDSINLSCPLINAVNYDIQDSLRGQTTTMGAWDFKPASLDLSVNSLISPAGSGKINTKLPLKIEITNPGLKNITTAQIAFVLNGVRYPDYSWKGLLKPGETAEVLLDSIMLVSGANGLTVFVFNPNNTKDEFLLNDTLHSTLYGCNTALSGNFTVGDSKADFATMEEAVANLRYCGINGPVVLNVISGEYEGISLANINSGDTSYTITIRSLCGNRDSVIFYDRSGLYIKDVSNFRFEELTLRGTVTGVEMAGTLHNVYFTHCNIQAPLLQTNSAYRSVSYPNTSSSTDYLDNVRFIANNISGGYYNFYLYYTAGSGTQMPLNSIIIDSNNLSGAYYYGIYSYYYNHFKSISHNYITNGTNSSAFYGMYLYYYNNADKVVGNRIHLNNTSTGYGLYHGYYGNYASYGGVVGDVSNNEIILTGNGTKYGMYLYDYSRFNVVNNSIYAKGSSTTYGIYTYISSSTYPVNLLNNNICVDYTSGYAVYYSVAASYAPAYGTRDYNNYYSRANIGYFNGADVNTLTALKAVDKGQDQHSLATAQVWKNSTRTDLRMKNSKVYACPIANNITDDILGEARLGNSTVMGCYTVEPDSIDVALAEFIGADNITSTGTHPVSVVVLNNGLLNVDSATIQFSINGIQQQSITYRPQQPLKYLAKDTVNLGSYAFANGSCELVCSINLQGDSNLTNNTLRLKRNVCKGVVKGIYVIGNSKSADYTFATIGNLVTEMNNCGVSGDVTLLVEDGTYSTSTIDLSLLASAMGDHHLTISSKSGDSSKVTISTTSTSLLILNGNKNVTISYLTLNSTTANIINITGNCENIEIYHNYIKGSTTVTNSTNSTPIYKASSTGLVKDLRIIGNRIEGGYYGIYLYGESTSSYNEDVIVDSNEIYNQYYYAAYYYYTEFSHISHNRIYPRKSSTTTWYGMRLYYCNAGEINGNHINSTGGSTITSPYGMYIYYTNYNNTDKPALIANNIIIAKTSSTYYGVYAYYTRMNFHHNSILMSGTGQGRGLYYSTSAAYPMNIKGNLFITDANQYPIYAGSTTAGIATLDYNNYYGNGTFIGYYGSAQNNLSAWQSITGEDAHSISKPVQFANTAQDLKLLNYADVIIPNIGIKTDFEGKIRNVQTAMGAHEAIFMKLDAALVDFAKTTISGTSKSNIEVTLANFGKDTLTSANIEWTVNGVSQKIVAWKGSLPLFGRTTVKLDDLTTAPDQMLGIRAWVTNPNNDKDMNRGNDTIEMKEYICNGKFAGTYYIGGNNADFADLNDAAQAITSCGISGPVVLKMRTGKYSATNINGMVGGANQTNTITVMPDNNAHVTIDGDAGTSLTVGRTAYWNFEGLTIGNTATGMVGVELAPDVQHITFHNCNIYASTTATTNTYKAVSLTSASGAANYPVDVRFIHNNIRGGYYNMYLYYMAGGTANMQNAVNMTLDSNTLTDAYYYGIYSYYYAHYRSLAHNKVTSRSNSSTYYGMYLYYYHNFDKPVEGNHVNVNCSSTGYGIYFYYYKNYSSYGGNTNTFCNNEVIVRGAGSKYGVYFYMPYQTWEFSHNSIYVESTSGTAYGAYLYNSSTSYKINAVNNLCVAKGSTPYPIYVSSATYVQSGYMTLDYNNYYSIGSSNIGYAGSAVTSLSAWQTASGMDANSVSVQPFFIDSTKSCELNDYTPFLCPVSKQVGYDINGNIRSKMTVMGAHSVRIYENTDLNVVEFVDPKPIDNVICYADNTPVSIAITNEGLKDADFRTSALKVSMDVTGAISYHFDTLITAGTLKYMQTDTFYLPEIPTMASGVYNIKITLNDTADKVTENDTLTMVHKAYRVELPYDVDFSTTPAEFVNNTMTGTAQWKVVQDTVVNPDIAPVFGTGCLEFDGASDPGAYVNAIFNAVNIHNCLNPTLSFWYAHNANCTANDMMIVFVTTDGGATYTEVKRILTYDTVTAWKQYDVDLTPFNQYSCLSVVFRAMSFGGSNQAIDRIRIRADKDASFELLPIDISQRTACDNRPVDVKAVVTNKSLMGFELIDDTITLNVTGAVTATNQYVYNKKLSGLESDTITLGQIDLSVNGYTYLQAYLQSLDDNTGNDTAVDSTIYVMQDIALDSIIGMDEQIFKVSGEQVNITAVAVNSGNITVDRVVFRMNLNGNNVATDTVHTPVKPGDTLVHAMSRPYTVPAVSKDQPFYFLEVRAELGCDGNGSNDSLSIVGNVLIPDSIDIQVLDITASSPAKGKTKVAPTVRIANIGNLEATGILLHVEVIDSADSVVGSISETVNYLSVNEAKDIVFTMNYTVPNYTGTYTLKAYVESCIGDTVQSNDTLSKAFANEVDDTRIRESEDMDWSLGQNIPNPAGSLTRIPFKLPQDAEVVFSVMSANGQLIYREQLSANSGDNTVGFNVNQLAGGIYYYSMEYKGQRIVRKMNVIR